MKKEIMPNNIRWLRNRAGMSQAELARRIEETPQVLGRYENRKRDLPRAVAAKIAAVFNVTTHEVMFPVPAPPKPQGRFAAVRSEAQRRGAERPPPFPDGRLLASVTGERIARHDLRLMLVDSDDIHAHVRRGEVALVDMDDAHPPKERGVYALMVGAMLVWRVLERVERGLIRVVADDPRIPPTRIHPRKLNIVGRVVAKISTV